MDLHYSQTLDKDEEKRIRFTTLWIYTILKLLRTRIITINRFTTLWIYTILKLV